MSIYKILTSRMDGRFENNVELKKNPKEGFCDFLYKGQVVLKVIDCNNFCVFESPILLSDDSFGHTLVVMDFDEELILSIIDRIDKGIKRLKIMLVVMQDRFPYYKKGKSLYFKVENAFLKLSLGCGEWKCTVLATPNSSFSYLNVINSLCEDFCNSIGCELCICLDLNSTIAISNSFL